MTQNVPWSVKGIDPQAREAAKDAARKAGMTLGAWMNSMIAESTQGGGSASSHRFVFDSDSQDAFSQDIFSHVADRLSLEAAALKSRIADTAAAGATAAYLAPQSATALDTALDTVAKRLDAIEARLDHGRDPEIVHSAVEKIEKRLETLTAAVVQSPGATAADDMLRTLETRLTEIMVRLGPEAPANGSAASSAKPAADRTGRDDDGEKGGQRTGTPFHEPITRPGGTDMDSDRFAATIAEIRRRQIKLSDDMDFGRADTEDADMDDTDRSQHARSAFGHARKGTAEAGRPEGARAAADFAERADTLTRKIDELLAPGRFPALDGVISRLDRIDAQMEHPKLPADFERVEQLLGAVAARLESNQRGTLDAESLDALEMQIEHLARRIDDALRTKLSDASLDKKLGDLEGVMVGLVDRVQGMQKDAIQSIEYATRTAVTDAVGAKIWDSPDDVGGLKADIADLKSVHQDALQQTQGTLTAVHQTLELVVQRLAQLETEQAGSSKTDASHLLFERHAARVLGDRALDMATATDTRPAAPDMARAAATPDVKSSFIAAARRAAQTATQEVARGEPARQEPARQEPARPESASLAMPARQDPTGAGPKADIGEATIVRGRSESLIERLRHGSNRRRNVMFGIAALVIAISAAQLIASVTRPPDGAAEHAADTPPQASGLALAGPEAPAAGLALAQPSAQATLPQAQPPAMRQQATLTFAPSAATPSLPASSMPAPAVPTPSTPAQMASQPGSPLVLSDFANPFAVTAPDTSITTGSIKPAMEALAVENKPAPAEAAPEPARKVELTMVLPKGLLASVPPSIGAEALRQAAEKGNTAAVYELAARLAEGRGMPRDMKTAGRLFEAQAEAGFVPAQYRIANHYEKGFGVDRDLAKAREWYLRAAEAGNAKAMHNLAVLYAEGISGKPDYVTAVQWFRKAAELGIRDSQFNLAILAARGLGMNPDLVQSYTWFAILAHNGDADAVDKRDSIAGRLSPTDLTLARAAAEQWSPKTPDPATNTVEISPEWTRPAMPKGTTGDANAGPRAKTRG